MSNYTDSKGRKVTVSDATVGGILRAHGFDAMADARSAHVTSICLACQSITESPDAQTRATAHEWLDLSCCGVTILF